jgi:hypothetical protein
LFVRDLSIGEGDGQAAAVPAKDQSFSSQPSNEQNCYSESGNQAALLYSIYGDFTAAVVLAAGIVVDEVELVGDGAFVDLVAR